MSSHDTKDRLLDAAERLFGAHGFEATSLRGVTAEAGVNLAAVHYHFGSKEALLRATAARRVEPINRERLRLLDKIEAEAPSEALPLEPILEAFLRPVLEVGRAARSDGFDFRQLAARLHSEPLETVWPLVAELFAEVVRRFVGALCRALPALSTEEVVLRFQFMGAVMIHVISGNLLNLADPRMPPAAIDDEALLEAMIAFAGAGLRAPATQQPGRGKRGREGAS
jgi:AcrR family transcriptional regulator